MKTIGFIGLGNMGKGMSINLSKEDLIVLGYDINVKSFEDLKHNKIEKINDLKSLTEKSDIIITMLPDGPAVKKVWQEIISHSRPRQYLIDCSTIDVKTSILVQKEAQLKIYLL